MICHFFLCRYKNNTYLCGVLVMYNTIYLLHRSTHSISTLNHHSSMKTFLLALLTVLLCIIIL